MKHLLGVLLCLLLCGCAPQTTPVPEAPTETLPPKVSLYAPGHPLEKAHPEVRAYPLPRSDVYGVRTFGEDVLVLSGKDSTTLTVFSGEELWQEASLTLDFLLDQEDLQVHEDALSFFDPQAQETLVLDRGLREVQRIAGPANLSGTPLLSPDKNTLYYCTGWAVMAWDLDSGIRRTVRELSHESQEITGLLQKGTVLQCTVRDGSEETLLFLSAADGRELDTLGTETRVWAPDSRYFAAVPAGKRTLLIFGEDASGPRMLLPEGFQDQQFYLEENHALVTVRETAQGNCLDHYSLSTGTKTASLTLESGVEPKNIIRCKDNSLYILVADLETEGHILCRWDLSPVTEDPADYSAAYSTAEEPDTQALAACRDYAQAIGETYGITVRIAEEAAEIQPWDYQFTPEHLAPILQQELTLLEESLSRYPEEILRQTAEHFSGLTIGLVREITGTPQSGSLSTATGIQFFQEGEAYVTIATGKYARQALYHEFYHTMESYLLTESTGLDQWENLNPAGFAYGSEGTEEVYLRGQTRAFVDRYSTTYPKEDRARIFEYAMLSGKEDLFSSEYLQRKLNTLCTAIRDAYGLNKHPEELPWEQYLITPLAPTK